MTLHSLTSLQSLDSYAWRGDVEMPYFNFSLIEDVLIPFLDERTFIFTSYLLTVTG
jgi:hypothetical protein